MSFFHPFLWPPSLWLLPRQTSDPVEDLVARNAPGVPLKTLIHVGAHVAQEREKYEALGYTDILWIEGSPTVYPRLVEVLNSHASSAACRHRSVCALLAERDGEEMLLRECSNDGMSSSVFQLTEEAMRRWSGVKETGRSERVPTRTLDSIADEYGVLNTVDTLIVDVQGAELLVLKGGEKVLKRVRGVVSEVSLRRFYAGGVLFPELYAFLSKRGFRPTAKPGWHGDLLFAAD